MDTSALMERITRLRKGLGLSERGVCLKAGLPVDCIRVIRRGHATRRERLRLLAQALECSASYLEEVAPDVLLNERLEDDRRELIELYQSLPPDQQTELMEDVRRLVSIRRRIAMGNPKAVEVAKIMPSTVRARRKKAPN